MDKNIFSPYSIKTISESFWHKIKRKLFARQILLISENIYFLYWVYKNGDIELIEEGTINTTKNFEIFWIK